VIGGAERRECDKRRAFSADEASGIDPVALGCEPSEMLVARRARRIGGESQRAIRAGRLSSFAGGSCGRATARKCEHSLTRERRRMRARDGRVGTRAETSGVGRNPERGRGT